MKQLSVILIGAGNRGRIYCRHMKDMPEKYKVVGVAEPHDNKRAEFAKEHGIPESACYKSWEEILHVFYIWSFFSICWNYDLISFLNKFRLCLWWCT